MIILNAEEESFAFIFREAKNSLRPVVFPTDTIYGIGAPISCIPANEKIFGIKKRSGDMPFPILTGSWEQAASAAKITGLSHEKIRFMKEREGSPVTYIFPATEKMAKIYQKDGTVAVRIPCIEWLKKGLLNFGEPVTATSANISKEPHAQDFPGAFGTFKDEVSLFLKGYPPSGTSSEIFDMTREGIIKIR